MLAGRGAEMGWLAQGYFIAVGMGQATQFDLIDMVRCTNPGGWANQHAMGNDFLICQGTKV